MNQFKDLQSSVIGGGKMGLHAVIKKGSWPEPPVFGLLKAMGNVSEEEMNGTFNMGIGYILVVDPGSADSAVATLSENGYDSHVIGSIGGGHQV